MSLHAKLSPFKSHAAALFLTLMCGATQSVSANENENKVHRNLQLAYLSMDGIYASDSGNIYAAEGFQGDTVYQISPNGITRDYINGIGGPVDIAEDTLGNIYVTNFNSGSVSRVSISGEVTEFASVLTGPTGIVADADNNLYVTHFGNFTQPNYFGDGDTVIKITPSGETSVFAAGGHLLAPVGIAIDDEQNIYTGNINNGVITKIYPNGQQEIYAQIESTSGWVIGHLEYAKGYLYATGLDDSKVYRISSKGRIKVMSKSKSTVNPNGITYDASTDSLLVSDAYSKNGSLIRFRAK